VILRISLEIVEKRTDSSSTNQMVPSAQLNRPSFHDVILPVKADAATVSGLAR